MPKQIINYKKSIIYKIVCKDLRIKESYIGSTTNIVKRRNKHKYDCNTEKSNQHNLKIYNFIREHGGWVNWMIILLEKYPCENKLELETRERYWIEKNPININTLKPARTPEIIKQQQKKYLEKNKDKKSKYDKEYKSKRKLIISEQNKRLYINNKMNKIITLFKKDIDEGILLKRLQVTNKHFKEVVNDYLLDQEI